MFEIKAETNGNEDCTEVRIRVSTDLPCERSDILFNFNTAHQYAAQLLVKHIRKELCNSLEEIRKQAYLQGYKDGRGKQKKKGVFCNHWGSEYVGY